MKLEWTESESDYGLEEAAFYEAPTVIPPPPRKHVSFSLRLDLVSTPYINWVTNTWTYLDLDPGPICYTEKILAIVLGCY